MHQANRMQLQKIFQLTMADEFKRHRLKNGLSQERMARKLRLSVRSYVDLEHGVYAPSAATMAGYLIQLQPEEQIQLLKTLREAWEQ